MAISIWQVLFNMNNSSMFYDYVIKVLLLEYFNKLEINTKLYEHFRQSVMNM